MIGTSAGNPYLFRRGGTISGDYDFEEADITLEKGTSFIRQADKPNHDVGISFDDKTIIHGDLEILGDVIHGTDDVGGVTNINGDLYVDGNIYAGNLTPGEGPALPSDVAFNSVFVTEGVQAGSVDTDQLTADSVSTD